MTLFNTKANFWRNFYCKNTINLIHKIRIETAAQKLKIKCVQIKLMLFKPQAITESERLLLEKRRHKI